MLRLIRLGALLVIGGLLVAACGQAATERVASPSPMPSPAASPSPAMTPAPTPEPTPGSEPIQILTEDVFEQEGSATCGEFLVEWSRQEKGPSGRVEAVLLVTAGDDAPILEVVRRFEPSSFAFITPLWCGDLLGDGSTVLGYSVFSGGAHCCFTAEAFVLGETPRRIL